MPLAAELCALLALFSAQDAASPYGFRRDGSGVFPGATPPTEWGEKKNIKWRTNVGAGNSSPVVAGDKVLVLAEPGTLWCLDRTKGHVIWNVVVGDVPDGLKKDLRDLPGLKERARATPVTDGQSVYVSLTNGVVACYTMKGSRPWVRVVPPAPLSYGPSASPVLAGKILLVDSMRLQAHEADTGNPLWKAAAAEPHYGTPALLTLDGTLLAVTAKGAVVRVSDGAVLARDVAAGLGGDQSPTPLIDRDVAYFAYRRCTAVKLAMKEGKVSAQKLWEQELPGDVISSPVLKDGMLFVIPQGAGYRVLEAKTGKALLEKDLDLDPNFYPSLALAGKFLFLGNDKGDTLVLDPSREFKLVRRNELPDGSGASPVFDGPNAFLRGGEFLYCAGP
jgi:outer membrane protein assembly factor BamB